MDTPTTLSIKRALVRAVIAVAIALMLIFSWSTYRNGLVFEAGVLFGSAFGTTAVFVGLALGRWNRRGECRHGR